MLSKSRKRHAHYTDLTASYCIFSVCHQGKGNMFEGSVRVPLLMRFPGQIEAGRTVTQTVSHLHVHATILDYLGFSYLDDSSGRSLRSAISNRVYHQTYNDMECAVVEANTGAPAFMIRCGSWKLLINNMEGSTRPPDALFNLQNDPFEQTNLLASTKTQTQRVIGKAEHLKCLLVEWMMRYNGSAEEKFYSDPKWNNYVGRGDIQEVRLRRTWTAVKQWHSEESLVLERPVWFAGEGKWRSNAWLYIGRTVEGTLRITNISLEGSNKNLFSVDKTTASITKNEYIRVRVSLESTVEEVWTSLDAKLVVKSNATSRRVVELKVKDG